MSSDSRPGRLSILFDLDGTLTDPRESIVTCIRYALGRLQRPAPPERELLRFIGPPLFEVFGTLSRVEATEPLGQP